MRMPMHGYLIARIANDQIGPWAKLSSGTLYTILAKLERTGLIALASQEASEPGGRPSRTYAITADGRERFRQLMRDTASNLADYQRWFYLKLIYFDLISAEDRALLWDHYITYCQTSAHYLETEAAALRHQLTGSANAAFLSQALCVMRRLEQQWRDEFAWAQAERAREAQSGPA